MGPPRLAFLPGLTCAFLAPGCDPHFQALQNPIPGDPDGDTLFGDGANCRWASRFQKATENRTENLGFRLVRTLP